MSLLKEVDINKLNPTDLDLSFKTISYYAWTFPLLEQHKPPEVWMIDNQMYIADGHHQIQDRYTRNNRIIIRLFTPENCGIGPCIYEGIMDFILKKAQKAREQGISHIKDLKIVA